MKVNDYFVVNADGSLDIGDGAFTVDTSGDTISESFTAKDRIEIFTYVTEAGEYETVGIIEGRYTTSTSGPLIVYKWVGIDGSLEVDEDVEVAGIISADTLDIASHTELRGSAFYNNNEIAVVGGSDKRLKENFKDITEAYEKAYYEIQPLLFNFKGKDINEIGIIAQDFEALLDKYGIEKNNCFIRKYKDEELGERYAIDYVKFTSWNMHMIQKQHKEIEALKDEVDELKNLVNKL